MSDDSEDDMPLMQRGKLAAAPAKSNGTVKLPPPKPIIAPQPVQKPTSKTAVATNGTPVAKKKPPPKSDSEDEESEDEDDEADATADSDEDRPLSQRKKAKPAPSAGIKNPKKRAASQDEDDDKPKRKKRASAATSNGPDSKEGAEQKWTTLKHAGVLFPPEYVPHGIKMKYDGKPVDLTHEQEEIASFYAAMHGSDYLQKPVFNTNFWEGFKEVLGKNHVIKSLDKCDFTPIWEWQQAQREAKKKMTKEEKAKLKKEREEQEKPFKTAIVDGRVEPVGNFRVEPPSLFRGRGEHPKMGKIKKRIYPRDITINIGSGEPVPTHPFPGQHWMEVRHDQTVTWLAFWKDTVSQKDYKYVFLAANSTFKADSDLQKYEKARKLKGIIGDVRASYEADWDSNDSRKRQMGVALYFIDHLALRAGHEKDEDEADTVGCCTLKVENVELQPPNHLKFDFLGKDSMRYENVVEVAVKVYKNVEKFKKIDSNGKRKNPGDMLFDLFDAQDLNKELKNIMEGLSVKVFRTYNASVVLDRLLAEADAVMNPSISVDAKKLEYDKANKEVAILCNHQRSIPKTYDNQMEKIQGKLAELNAELSKLEEEVASAKGKEKESAQAKVERKRVQLAKAEVAAASKESLKTVALGTSKINYMDPRITVAWCKRNEVPMEKIFNKSLLLKFYWAMDVEPDFKW